VVGDIEKEVEPKADLQAADNQDPYAHALVSIKAAEKLLEIAYFHWRRPVCIA
jgi:hypothetical protein